MKRYKSLFKKSKNIQEVFYILNTCVFNNKLQENLGDWVENQLKKAGLFDKDSDYEGMIGKSVMELVQTFRNQRHSGFSANIVNSLFSKLTKYEPITPIDNPMLHNEYIDQSECSGYPMYQSNILYNMFSKDNGKNWYLLLDKPGVDEDGISYCTYEKVNIKEFPFNYEDYKNIYKEG